LHKKVAVVDIIFTVFSNEYRTARSSKADFLSNLTYKNNKPYATTL